MSEYRRFLMKKNGGGLPAEFQRVEYIESSGKQYINTNYLVTKKTNLFLDLVFVSNFDNAQNGCSLSSSNRFLVCSITNRLYVAMGNGLSYNLPTNHNERYQVLLNQINNEVIINEINYPFTSSYTNIIYTFCLFARNNEGNISFYTNERIFNCKIYENNVVAVDLIPCYRKSDNEIGLYDIVNGIFYTNQGTGVFIAGADVN